VSASIIFYFPECAWLIIRDVTWCLNICLQSAPFDQLRISFMVFLFEWSHPQNKNYFRKLFCHSNLYNVASRSAIVVLGNGCPSMIKFCSAFFFAGFLLWHSLFDRNQKRVAAVWVGGGWDGAWGGRLPKVSASLRCSRWIIKCEIN